MTLAEMALLAGTRPLSGSHHLCAGVTVRATAFPPHVVTKPTSRPAELASFPDTLGRYQHLLAGLHVTSAHGESGKEISTMYLTFTDIFLFLDRSKEMDTMQET